MTGHHGGIVALAAAVLKARPVAVTAGSDGALRLWDLRAAQEPGPAFAGDTAEVTALACKDLGGRPVAVTGGADGAVRVWDLVTRQQIGGLLTGHAGPVGDVACIPVEEHSAAVTRGEADGTIRVWDLVHRRQIGEPLGRRPADGTSGLRESDRQSVVYAAVVPATRWMSMTASLMVGMVGVLKSPVGGWPAGLCAQAVAVVLSLF